MRGNLNSYRFGYHSLSRSCIGSEYAKDETEETGWNSFEARIACADASAYDPVIGRWLSVDPARQFASPYVGMGNNPVSGVDPDGRDCPIVLMTKDLIYIGIMLLCLDMTKR